MFTAEKKEKKKVSLFFLDYCYLNKILQKGMGKPHTPNTDAFISSNKDQVLHKLHSSG